MTREEKRMSKYPETETFHYYNANPKGRITSDCRIRAIAVACEVPYNKVVMDLAEIQCKTGYDQTTNQGLNILLKQYGWTKIPQPRKLDNTKYTGVEWCEAIKNTFYYDKAKRRIIINIGGHHMSCIINGKVWDIWDCTDNCIGNYWIKITEN